MVDVPLWPAVKFQGLTSQKEHGTATSKVAEREVSAESLRSSLEVDAPGLDCAKYA